MMWIERNIADTILKRVKTRPVILLTGIRQSGKSALLRKLFPDARYISFDHYHHIESATSSPSRFLSDLQGEEQIILDKIQYVPHLFRELKILIDQNRTRPARWILTGSQKFSLLHGARESLAGRIGLIELETLGCCELRPYFKCEEVEKILWKGGFPEIWAEEGIGISSYMDDYITTYLEKDLREIIHTPNLRDFHRFLRACALRCGSLINYSDLARDTGISPNTAKNWFSALVQSGIITALEPWFHNLSKRLSKTPKMYFNDQGLLCRLLNIRNYEQIKEHPLVGGIWENLLFNELIRLEEISADSNLFYYRDQNKVEVDFLVETGNKTVLIEAKYSERPGKTNLPKVEKLLKNGKENCYTACRIPEEGIFTTGDSSLVNPLLTDLQKIL